MHFALNNSRAADEDASIFDDRRPNYQALNIEESDDMAGEDDGFFSNLCSFECASSFAPPTHWPMSFNEGAALYLRQAPTEDAVDRWEQTLTRGSPVHEATSPSKISRRPIRARAYSDDAPVVKSRIPLHTAALSDTSWLPQKAMKGPGAAAKKAAAAKRRQDAVSQILENHPKLRQFRSQYSNWRKGAAKGAKGELTGDGIEGVGVGGDRLVMDEATSVPLAVVKDEPKVPTEATLEREQILEDLNEGIALWEEMKETIERRKEGSSLLQTIFNGLNAMMGLVLLATPLILSEVGWVLLPIIVLIMMVSSFTVYLLDCCQAKTNCVSFPDVAEAAFGPTGRWVAGVFAYVDLAAIGVGCIIINAKSLVSLCFLLGHPISPLVSVAIVGVVSSPTCLLQDLAVISYLSAFGLLANIGTMALVLSDVFMHLDSLQQLEELGREHTRLTGDSMIVPLSLIFYQFALHSLFPSLRASMKDPSQANQMSMVVMGVIALSVIIFASICYMFFETVTEQITSQLGNGSIALVANAMVFLNSYTKLPLSLFPVCNALVELLPATLQSKEDYAYTPHYADNDPHGGGVAPSSRGFMVGFVSRVIVLTATVLVAMLCPMFTTIVGFCSWVIAPALVVAIPIACYVKLFEDELENWQIQGSKVVVVLVLLAGVAGMALQLSQELD